MPDQPLSLFISYKRVDSAFVDRLEVDLRVRGFDTWLDRRDLASRGGANWRREPQIAIDRAHALVLVLTPDAAASPYVGWEYRYAVAIGRPIYVLLLRDCPSGVPQEILADSIHWFDFRGEPSYPQRLALLVDHLMDLPTDAPPPRPSDVKFADDSPIVLKPAGAIEMRRPTPKSDAQLDDLYRRAVKAEVAGQLDRATDLFHRIIDANPTYRNNFIANRMPELLRKRTEVWIERLKKIAYQARLEGEWGLEIAAWNAMVTETNGDPRAHKGLELAKHNQSFAWLYKEALSLYNSGDIASAKHPSSTSCGSTRPTTAIRPNSRPNWACRPAKSADRPAWFGPTSSVRHSPNTKR
ncbi:MAG: toll/interleukin-1 receptor domain-containing protein [Chloroflexi bacterium]|nr:toll/interleukin-1 receptor domain-containing protein [Chloroflexota bacterium]